MVVGADAEPGVGDGEWRNDVLLSVPFLEVLAGEDIPIAVPIGLAQLLGQVLKLLEVGGGVVWIVGWERLHEAKLLGLGVSLPKLPINPKLLHPGMTALPRIRASQELSVFDPRPTDD